MSTSVKKILVGPSPMTGLKVYREINEESPFVPLISEKRIDVYYKEYHLALDDKTRLLETKKRYFVMDLPEKKDKDGNVTQEAYPAFTNWFNRLKRGPIAENTPGIYDAIEDRLAKLPIGCADEFILIPNL